MLRSPSSSHHTLLLRIEPLVFVNIIILRRDLARWSMVFLLWGLSVFRSGLNFSTFLCRNSSSIFRFSVKGRLMCIVLYTNIVQITMCFLSHWPITPRHWCVIMHEVVDESLRKIDHYQQNVLQHYYLLDTLVIWGIPPTATN